MSINQPSLKAIHQYWMNPTNPPIAYLNHPTRSITLVKIIKKYCEPKDEILEIGPNIGRNLKYLFEAGYRNLHCVEINMNAIDLMKKIYPKVAKSTRIHTDAIENVITKFKDDEFHTVFTMATLEHIHYDSEWIFPELVRITKHILITIEDERRQSWKHFKRNYKHVFEKFGMKQIQAQNPRGLPKGFKARIFKKKS